MSNRVGAPLAGENGLGISFYMSLLLNSCSRSEGVGIKPCLQLSWFWRAWSLLPGTILFGSEPKHWRKDVKIDLAIFRRIGTIFLGKLYITPVPPACGKR
jgi:hypothetical protein